MSTEAAEQVLEMIEAEVRSRVSLVEIRDGISGSCRD